MRVYLKTGKQANMQLKLRILNLQSDLIYFFLIPLLRQMLSAACFHFLSGTLLSVMPELFGIMWGLPYQGRRESGKSHFQKTWFLDCLTVVKVTSEASQTASIDWWQNSSVLSLPILFFSNELQNWTIWQTIEVGSVRPNFVFLKG